MGAGGGGGAGGGAGGGVGGAGGGVSVLGSDVGFGWFQENWKEGVGDVGFEPSSCFGVFQENWKEVGCWDGDVAEEDDDEPPLNEGGLSDVGRIEDVEGGWASA